MSQETAPGRRSGLAVVWDGAGALLTQRGLLGLLPSVAKFAPENAPKPLVLAALGVIANARVSAPLVCTTATVVSFGGGLIAAAFAR